MVNISIDTKKVVKGMKAMHAGGQPPLGGANQTEYIHYITEAGIPFSRLHDVGGYFGGGRYVDIPNVFRNFDADENDPDSYDFAFTDFLLKVLVDANVEPYYRLGITIENFVNIKAYHTAPPKDYHKWARICEHVIRHYTEGWANGFYYNIRYWEIWNEPEGVPVEHGDEKAMWSGTAEQFFELYDVAAKHLKACFPHIKIGGYGSVGFNAVAPLETIDPETHQKVTVEPNAAEKWWLQFFYDFFAYIKERNTPIDFFSWHSYNTAWRIAKMDAWLHETLQEMGYGDIETHLNEWNPCYHNTLHKNAAMIAATMIALQHGHTDVCCIYDMKTTSGPWAPLFDLNTHKPKHGYYSMVAFNTLYQLKNQVQTTCDEEKLYVLGASDGNRHAMMIANVSGARKQLSIEGVNEKTARYYALDKERLLSWAPNAKEIDDDMVILIEWQD
ncbi:MAG: hypothetical protein IJB97_02845 [Clostridia bacterium]|nr:hypothetical protein [Clostridia bacterium]